MVGVPAGPFDHSQNFPTRDHVLQLLRLNIEQECTVDSGLEYDTIIVNNDTGWAKGNEWLKSIDNQPTKNGKIIVHNRENFGRAFGGYDYAFSMYEEVYDNWIFTEDDVLINVNNFYLDLVNQLKSNKQTGAVAIIGVSFEDYYRNIGKKSQHCHGSIALYDTEILRKIKSRHGMIPHVTKNIPQSYENQIMLGEVLFSNTVVQLGYDIVVPNKKMYNFAYDFMRGIDVVK
jgi:hypothetical protein